MKNSSKKPTMKAMDILGVKKLNILEQSSIKGGKSLLGKETSDEAI